MKVDKRTFSMMAHPSRFHDLIEGDNMTLHFYGAMLRSREEELPSGPGPSTED